MNKFFLRRKLVVSRQRKVVALENEPINWKKAGQSFARLLKTQGATIRRLADARTYRDFYLEDGIEPPS